MYLPTITRPITKVKAALVSIGPTDPISDIPVFIDFAHHQIHEGETHRAEDYQASLGATTVKYGITVPTYTNTIYAPHMVIEVDVYNGNIIMQLYEAATFTSGSPLTKKNRNRNSAITGATTVTGGVTSSDGTLIHTIFGGAGRSGSGSDRSDVEYVLKSNTLYRVDLIGRAAGTEAVISFNWYEDLGV